MEQSNQSGHNGQILERVVQGPVRVVTPGADIADEAPQALSAPDDQGSLLQSQMCLGPLGDQSSTDFSPCCSPVFPARAQGLPAPASPLPTCFHGPCSSEGLAFYCRDTAGQERYQTITKQYYRRAQVSCHIPGLEVECCHPHSRLWVFEISVPLTHKIGPSDCLLGRGASGQSFSYSLIIHSSLSL